MKRILSVWLPHLAIERWARSSDFAPDDPVVLTVEGTHGLTIHAVTKAAAERGARAGARLTDARALDPSLVAVPADPAGDEVLVERLARWAGRWSPLVEVDGANALRLDVTGVPHLFGGEGGLLADVQMRFAVAGLSTRVAMAPTAAAAWALAHYGNAAAVICGKDTGAKLADLPVAALRLPSEATRTLERLGLKTVGTLAGIERRALARRFREKDNPVDALDRALGRKPEPVTAVRAERPPRALLKLEEPATHPEVGGQALERLVPDLVRQLQQRHLGVRRLALIGYRVDGSTARASVATAIPSREPKHLQRLLADKAAALDPGIRFRRLRAGGRLGGEPRLDAGQPGRRAGGNTRSGTAGRSAERQARFRQGEASAAIRKPFARTGERVGDRYPLHFRGGEEARSAEGVGPVSDFPTPSPLA